MDRAFSNPQSSGYLAVFQAIQSQLNHLSSLRRKCFYSGIKDAIALCLYQFVMKKTAVFKHGNILQHHFLTLNNIQTIVPDNSIKKRFDFNNMVKIPPTIPKLHKCLLHNIRRQVIILQISRSKYTQPLIIFIKLTFKSLFITMLYLFYCNIHNIICARLSYKCSKKYSTLLIILEHNYKYTYSKRTNFTASAIIATSLSLLISLSESTTRTSPPGKSKFPKDTQPDEIPTSSSSNESSTFSCLSP